MVVGGGGWGAGLTALVLLAGCGTRVSHQAVLAATGGEVSIAPASIEAIRAAAAGRPGSSQTQGSSTASVAPAPARSAAVAAPRAAPLRHAPVTRPIPVQATAALPSVSTTCVAQGTPVVLGQVGSFSGLIGPVTSAARTTMAAWVQDVNSRGGLACHPVVLYQRDDASDPSRSAAAVAELVSDRKAVALVGAMSILSVTGFADAAERAGVPVVGGDILTNEWEGRSHLYMQGAGEEAQIGGMINELLAEKMKRLGLLECVETTACSSTAPRVAREVKRAGAELVLTAEVSLAQPDYLAQCQNAKNAGVQALVLGMDGASIGRLARSCATIGYHPVLASSGGVLIQQDRFVVSSPNAPWFLIDSPAQRALHDALARYAPAVVLDANAMSAWASGQLLEAAIARLGAAARNGPITTAMVLSGLAHLRNETLGGLAPSLTFEADRSREKSSRCVFVEVLTTEGWTAPRGSRPVCT
jgi:branched-chain amino acid transport system substrate-binding protein